MAVHPTYARLLCIVLRELQVDVDAMLASVNLSWPQLAVMEQMLSVDTVQQLGIAAVRTSQRPWLGLELGQALQTSAHGPVGYAMVSSRDLRQAFEVLCQYGALRHEAIRFELETLSDGVILRVKENIDFGELRHFGLDAVFGTVLKLIESVGVKDFKHITVDLPRPEPAWIDRYQRIFNGTLNFNAPALAFHVDNALLDAPNATADAHDHEAACRECERAQSEAARGHDLSLTSKVRECLQSGRDTYPSLEHIASQLHISSRTLIRKLKNEGSSYQALLDELRQERALWYLQHTQLPVAEIAERLGYLDTSNFSRTFRHWFGVTPIEMRNKTVAP